jgi:CO dehydrogenase maturation factor
VKIAITGKGGVGKTTLAAILCHLFEEEGKKVIAVDADPDANLALALGIPREELQKIRPITDMERLIEERTGAKPGSMGSVFKLNPRVDDLPESIGYRINKILLLTMGKIKSASSGCYCPENVFLRSLLKHLIMDRREIVILDMEAGIEHLTRGTSDSVDAFIVVVEPGQRSIQTAMIVSEMAETLGINNVFVVANKMKGSSDLNFIMDNIRTMELIGSISYSSAIIEADMKGSSPYFYSQKTVNEVKKIKEQLADKLRSIL